MLTSLDKMLNDVSHIMRFNDLIFMICEPQISRKVWEGAQTWQMHRLGHRVPINITETLLEKYDG